MFSIRSCIIERRNFVRDWWRDDLVLSKRNIGFLNTLQMYRGNRHFFIWKLYAHDEITVYTCSSLCGVFSWWVLWRCIFFLSANGKLRISHPLRFSGICHAKANGQVYTLICVCILKVGSINYTWSTHYVQNSDNLGSVILGILTGVGMMFRVFCYSCMYTVFLYIGYIYIYIYVQ